MKNVGNSIPNGEKHTVIFEQPVWEKIKNIAEDNNMTVSYIINALIKNIDSVESKTVFIFNEREKGDDG